jgi:hypothetical protein
MLSIVLFYCHAEFRYAECHGAYKSAPVPILPTGNTNLIKVACFVKKERIFAISKAPDLY